MSHSSRNFRITSTRDGSRHFQNEYNSESVYHFKNNRGMRGNKNYRGRNSKRFQSGNRGGAILRLIEDDVFMEGDASSSNNRNFQNKNLDHQSRHSRGYSDKLQVVTRLGLPIANTGASLPLSEWYKAAVLQSKTLTKDFILKAITSLSTVPFIPLNYHVEGKSSVFYIRGYEAANAIRSISRRITAPNGFKLVISVSPCKPPPSDLSKEVVETIKSVMSKRFNQELFLLNLSDFGNDPDFQSQGINLSMSRTKVVATLLDLIAENIPELKALDLSNNQISMIDLFSKLSEKAPKIVNLNLSNNQIANERDLNCLTTLNIEEFLLEGNPLTKRFQEKQAYISVIRKKFPKVITLDGQLLPPPITFNIETTELPVTKDSYFENDVLKTQICLFVEQFFSVYDSGDRQTLIGAYHERASFSLSIFFIKGYQTNNSVKQPYFKDYMPISRNMKQISRSEQMSRLKYGRTEIINLLKKLPATQHIPSSFIVDVNIISQTMLIFTINGVFMEKNLNNSNKILRSFSRVLVTVPNGPGLAIINDVITITNGSHELYKKYTAELSQSVNVPTPIQTNINSTASTSSIIKEQLTSEQKMNMINLFQLKSGMNQHYSQLCLSENDWNFEMAAVKYAELKQQNIIPPEAFIK